MSDEKADQKTEYKGAMRLPTALHGRLDKLSTETRISLNTLIVDAADFLCTLAEASDTADVPLPLSVVTAHAVRRNRENPVVISLGDRYGAIRPKQELGRVAETPPDPKEAQARRASGRR